MRAQLQVSRNDIQFQQEGNPDTFPADSVTVLNPDPGLYGMPQPNIRNSQLDNVALLDRGPAEDHAVACADRRRPHRRPHAVARRHQFRRHAFPAGQPFTKTWDPVSYRAAATFEPVKGLMLYGMTATAYDPAAAGIFSVIARRTRWN